MQRPLSPLSTGRQEVKLHITPSHPSFGAFTTAGAVSQQEATTGTGWETQQEATRRQSHGLVAEHGERCTTVHTYQGAPGLQLWRRDHSSFHKAERNTDLVLARGIG